MRKYLVIPLTLLFMVIIASPAWAGVNLNINGKLYEPTNPLQLEQGTTMGPLYVVGRVLGAEVSTSGQIITIKEAANTLVLTVNSTSAAFNGKSVTLPRAPEMVNGEIMVPLRFIYESFGAKVDWQGQNKTVAVKYSEQRQGLSVEEMLAKSSAAMEKYNTYKMKINMSMQTEVAESPKPGEKQKLDMDSQMLLATQLKPVLMYGKTSVAASLPQRATAPAGPAESEMLINEKGMYMTMPGQGWVKFDLPGIDMKSLMEQSGSQDPMSSLKQMKDFGVVMSYGDDREKNGKPYWIINVTMGADSLNKVFGDTMKKLPVQGKTETKDVTEGISNVMTDMFKNLQADVVYNVWIDQSNYQAAFMDLDARMKMKMQIPAQEQNAKASSVEMDMKEKASYEIYDLGQPFTVPDVSTAISMKEYMEKQAAIAPTK